MGRSRKWPLENIRSHSYGCPNTYENAELSRCIFPPQKTALWFSIFLKLHGKSGLRNCSAARENAWEELLQHAVFWKFPKWCSHFVAEIEKKLPLDNPLPLVPQTLANDNPTYSLTLGIWNCPVLIEIRQEQAIDKGGFSQAGLSYKVNMGR